MDKTTADGAGNTRKPDDIRSDDTLDLRKTPCPGSFIAAKLILDMMTGGRILKVLLVNNQETLKSFPHSIKEEGHEICKVDLREKEMTFFIRVKK